MDRVLPRQPFERLGKVDNLARRRVGVVLLLQRLPRLQARVERLARPFRDQLRDLVDDAVRDLEHAPRVAHRRARGHRPERDDLGDAVAAVLLRDVVDDAVASLDGEVDVGVGQRLAARVEEALEQEVVLDRVEVGDLEAVGDERAGGGAAAGPDADPVPLREVDEVPDDQEVVDEAHLLDRLQLEFEPVGQLRGRVAVALVEATLGQLEEVLERVAFVGRRVFGQQDLPELERDVAALGDLERAAERIRVAGEVRGHLFGRLEEELVGVELPVVRVLERVAGLDAEQSLVRARVLVVQVVHVAGGDERQPGALGELREQRIDAGLRLEPRVLNLDVGVVLAEDLDEPVEVGGRVAGPVFLERLGDAAGETAGERDEPLGVGVEQLPVDARLVVVALEVTEGRELDQVGVTGVVGSEQRQVCIALGLSAPVVGDVDLAADDGPDTVLRGLLGELDSPGEGAVVGERNRGHFELGSTSSKRGNPASPVEDAVLGVDVQVNERRLGHGKVILATPADGSAKISL